MKVKNLIICCLATLAMSCSSSHKTVFFTLFKNEKLLKHNNFGINPDDIQTPYSLSIVDTFLVAQNLAQSINNTFDVYSLNSKQKLHEYLPTGGGPCELPGGIASWRTRLPHSIEFNNHYRRTISAFNIGEPFTPNTCTFDTILDYSNMEQPIFNISQMNDSIFILLGHFSKGRIGVFNSKTKKFNAYLDYPDSDEVKVDNIAKKASIFFGVPTFHPDGSRFAMMAMEDIFEIFDYKNSQLSIAKAYYGEMPKYRTMGDGELASSRDAKRGFQNGCSTGKYIYLLYSTRTLAEPIFTTDCLFVFDWEGRPVQRYKLDVPTLGVCTNDDKTLYAIAEVGDDIRIVTFDLEDLAKK